MKIDAIYVAVFALTLATSPLAIAAPPSKGVAGVTPSKAPASCNASSLKTASLPFDRTKLENSQKVQAAATDFVLQLVANYEYWKNSKPSVADPLNYALKGGDLQFIDALIPAVATGSYPTNTQATLSQDAVASCRATSTTGNTNKQTGAPAAAEGTTSTTELTGIPELLSLAVENGAVTNSVSGSTMTLGTSLYGALKGFHLNQDSSSDYKECRGCAQIGGSATFNVANNSDALASATRKQISQWQLKYSFRDQSNRSSKVMDSWKDTAAKSASGFAAVAKPKEGPAYHAEDGLEKLFDEYVAGIGGLASCLDAINAVSTNALSKSATSTCSLVAGPPTNDGLATIILQGLDSDPEFKKALADAQSNPALIQFALDFQNAQDTYNADVTKFEAAVDNLSKGFNADITFGQQFPTTATTSSTSSTATSATAEAIRPNAAATTASTHIPDYLAGGLDLSWQPKTTTAADGSTNQAPTPTMPSVTFNAKTSFYTNPNVALNEKTFRGATAAFQAQWTLGGSPFVTDPNDKSKVTLAANGSYQRLQENKDQTGKRPDIALGSIKLTIPFPSGISFPVAFTVGSAKQQQAKGTYVVGNFGISFDADKLAALLALKH